MTVDSNHKHFNQINSLIPFMQVEPKEDQSLWRHGAFNKEEKKAILFETMPQVFLDHFDEAKKCFIKCKIY